MKIDSTWNTSMIVKKTLPKRGKLTIMKDIKSGELFLGRKVKYEVFDCLIHEGNDGGTSFTPNRVWKYIPPIDENPEKWNPITSQVKNKIMVFHVNDNSSFPYILGYIDENNSIRHGINYYRKTPINEVDYFFEID